MMSKTYEVWSVTTFNRFGQVFTELSEAEAILKQSRESWPDDEFAIVEYGEDRIPRLVGESYVYSPDYQHEVIFEGKLTISNTGGES